MHGRIAWPGIHQRDGQGFQQPCLLAARWLTSKEQEKHVYPARLSEHLSVHIETVTASLLGRKGVIWLWNFLPDARLNALAAHDLDQKSWLKPPSITSSAPTI
jgi:hypothetical protein